jgi:LysR family carnitine catabolism transcriptional activator
MVSIKSINAFCVLAQSQSFAEASQKLHISQPALSTAIKKMEGQLGGVLFSRSTRTLKLTPEGATFLPVAKRLLADWENALDDVKQLFRLDKGILTISSMPSFAEGELPYLLSCFGYAQPRIGIRVLDVVMELVIENVLNERAELGFIFEPEDTDLIKFTPMFNDEFIVVMPPKHALTEVRHITVDDIVEYPFVSMNRGSTMRKWVDERLATSSARIRIAGEASQFSTIGNLVYSGMGIAIVPAMVEQQMCSKGCISAVVDDLKIIKRVGMITAKNKGLSSVAQAFIKNLKLKI